MKIQTMKRRARRVFANDNDALVPELWSSFGLAILESLMVAGQLVYRDFENDLREYGDVVNTRRPQGFSAKRKVDSDTVTVQDARLTNIPVPLDQHIHVSFLIKDGEASKSMKSLIATHLVPAMTAMAEQIDRIVLGQYPRFLFDAGQAGTLGGMTSSNAKDYILELGQRLDESRAPMSGRSLIVPPGLKTKILQNAVFSEADKRGDQGTALREASMGRILGFDTYACQNMASVPAIDTATGFLINNAAGYPKGTTVMTVDTGTGAIGTGSFIKLGGRVYQITAHTETLGNTTSITVNPPLLDAVANNDAITQGDPGAVNLVAGYAAGWAKDIAVDGFTNFPRVGQAVSFHTLTGKDEVYTVIATDGSTTILLDRPLKTAIADDQVVNVWPGAGDFGLGFLRNAIALVCRPLTLPLAKAGALAGAASHQSFSLRTVITYDGDKQGHLVTIDCLLGVAVLDENCGAVLLG